MALGSSFQVGQEIECVVDPFWQQRGRLRRVAKYRVVDVLGDSVLLDRVSEPRAAPCSSSPIIQEMEERETPFGTCLYIRVFTNSYRQLSWSEVWDTFQDAYPGRWACQWFPPSFRVIDEENIYHLFVLPQGIQPRGMDIQRC